MVTELAALMREVRNYFVREKQEGRLTVSGGILRTGLRTPYAAIQGSTCYDGVYECRNGAIALPDRGEESFSGVVWGLNPPAEVLTLCEAIRDYNAKAEATPIAAESFGAYSRTLARDASGGVVSWQGAFARQLAPYRRMFCEVSI